MQLLRASDYITFAVTAALLWLECLHLPVTWAAGGGVPDEQVTEVVAKAPVNPVKVGGIMSLHCQVRNLPEHGHVSLHGTLNGRMEKLAENEFVLPNIEDRVFLSVRRMEDSSVVYFLSITDVKKSDGGIFTCRVTISHNTQADELVDYASVKLDVYHVPVETYPLCSTSLSGQQQKMQVKAGTLIRLNCTSETANPAVGIQWSRTGEGRLPGVARKMEQHGMSYSILEFRVSEKENNAMFICTVSSVMFPTFQRTCHVGPIVVESDSPNRSDQPAPINPGGVLSPTDSYGLTTSKPGDVATPRLTLSREDCLATCDSRDSNSQVFYWILTTTVAATLALIFFTVGMVLLIRYYRLHSTPSGVHYTTPDGKTFHHPQSRVSREDTYAELERKPSDKQFYMALEIKEHLDHRGHMMATTCPPRAINEMVIERQYRGPNVN